MFLKLIKFNRILLISILLLCRMETDFHTHPQFIVWNVGQGQWTTAILDQYCIHFDWGGEYFPIKPWRKICQSRKNIIYLSHWDWDHIGGLENLKKFPEIETCIAAQPIGETTSSKKKKLLSNFSICKSTSILRIQQSNPIKNLTFFLLNKNRRQPLIKSSLSNSLSQVFSFNNEILLPGDSPVQQEKIWVRANTNSLKSIKLLVLGHHGSRTSSSPYLLSKMPQIKFAIASARYKRYGHPHYQVTLRLRKNKIPLLRTEDWGHLRIEL